MRLRREYLLVPLILLLGAGSAALMIVNRKTVQPKPPEVVAPIVRVQTVTPTNLQLIVHSQGTVRPRTAISLASEVAGRVAAVASSLAAGGFFEKEEVLVQIEPRDFELAVVKTKAQVAGAQARLTREEAEAEIAALEWKALNRQTRPTSLVLREPQLAEARATLASAEAALEEAERQLDKTRIRAPFAGRVVGKEVDVGQFVNRGATVARIYGNEVAEVRLPLPVEQMAYLDLSLAFRDTSIPSAGPMVRLRGQFAGQQNVWTGKVVRTEGEIDEQTRMVTIVAEVEDPFARDPAHQWAPLPMGLFLQAEIMGRELEQVFIIPRIAMRSNDRLLVVDAEDKLRFHQVEVLRADRDHLIIQKGLETGNRICLSPLSAPVEGLSVRPFESDTQTQPRESAP